MSILGLRKQARLIFYRFQERGLEVFLLNKSDEWGLPGGDVDVSASDDLLELEPNEDRQEAVAVEADWHEIPSLKQMLLEEGQEVAERIRELEGGSFVSIKEALKSRLKPNQVAFLRELRDVMTDRNSVRDL